MQNVQTLIYLHLQKTGGRTFRHMMHRLYNADDTFSFKSPFDTAECYEVFKTLSETERRRIKLVIGQLTYGLHKELSQDCTYIAFARNPIERTLSHYYYIFRNEEHPDHNYFVEKNLSLEGFLEEYPYTGYYQTRSFIAVDDIGATEDERRKPLPDNGLEDAKRNVDEHFSLVGLTERYDESLLLMKRAFGWEDIRYLRFNTGTNRPKKPVLPKETRQRLEQHLEIDLEFHEHVKKRFEEAIVDYGDDFSQVAEDFKKANIRYSKRHKLHIRIGPAKKLFRSIWSTVRGKE